MGDYEKFVETYRKFLRERVTELRIQKGVSEYRMSSDLAQSKNYIQGISSGKALPSMTMFFNICEYFDLTPADFFDSNMLYPQLVRQATDRMRDMNESDMKLLLDLMARMKQ